MNIQDFVNLGEGASAPSGEGDFLTTDAYTKGYIDTTFYTKSQDDTNSGIMNTAIAAKMPKAGGTFTGAAYFGLSYLDTTGDIILARTGGTTAAIYFNSAKTAYIYWDGSYYNFSPGGVKSSGRVYASSAYLEVNGDIAGSVWTAGVLSTHIDSRATAWANDRVANLQYRKVSRGYTTAPSVDVGGGAVLVGYERVAGINGQVAGLYYKTLQVYDPVRGWVQFGDA
jgi:hypothetical protein